MYKVFINEREFILADDQTPLHTGDGVLHVRYDDSFSLPALIGLAGEDHPSLRVIQVMHPDAEALFRIFSSYFTLEEAAGGVVKNDAGELLVIYRRGKWDLPKGKIDAGESPEAAALREVEEECGIGGMTITAPLAPTWHTFSRHGQPVLKKTHWFAMHCPGRPEPVPQHDEDIEKALWAGPAERKACAENTYRALLHFFS